MHEAGPFALQRVSSANRGTGLSRGCSRIATLLSRVASPSVARRRLAVPLHRDRLNVRVGRAPKGLGLIVWLLLRLELGLPRRAGWVEGDLVADRGILTHGTGQRPWSRLGGLTASAGGARGRHVGLSWLHVVLGCLSCWQRLPPNDPAHDGPLAS